MNQIGKDYTIITEQLFLLFQNREYHDLVVLLFSIVDKIKDMKISQKSQDIESKAESDIYINRYRRKIDDLINSLNNDFDELIVFAYYLRMLDVHNTYTKEILNGIVQPPVIEQIILANEWDKDNKIMIPTSKNQFKLYLGVKNSLLSSVVNHEGSIEAVASRQNEANKKNYSLVIS